ncbi:INTS7 isoform 5 [Pan troglodytes]|uniref:INTS7 isoform 5 n=1 Tax=Pan troglodytes TaxID=9598 RepID=A0A2J8QVH7_PANTR|nr:INTS7 isoform 5 [Pan troglodytes]
MASNSTKSFLADAGYGEQELDANSALMELDKDAVTSPVFQHT